MRQRRSARASLALGLLLLAAGPRPATAWLADGHRLASRRALESLPARLPAFLRAGGSALAAAAVDPDLMRHRALPQLRSRESPEHFVDLELLAGRSLPPTRWEYVQLVTWLGADPVAARRWGPADVGMLPYAVVESYQRLALAFAEHRARPEDRHLQEKILAYAGWLAHYAQDLCQPLHTTIHHDGRAAASGGSPGSGIHRLTDALFSLPGVSAAGGDPAPRGVGEVFPAVASELARSHALVERVYELERAMRRADRGGSGDAALTAFARERFATTVGFTAGLLLSAWEESATLELPSWLAPAGQSPSLAPQPPR